ncbi:MAG: Ig-like domain-containing protein [Deltaproteobacteria bacterium]|nr:Ig-like domain-containing protein [Deltaproteobacteria bacterium]
MKRLLITFICLAMFSVIGCGEEKEDDGEDAGPDGAASADGDVDTDTDADTDTDTDTDADTDTDTDSDTDTDTDTDLDASVDSGSDGGQTPELKWSVESVLTGEQGGQNTSIAVNTSGTVYIANVLDGVLSNPAGPWLHEEVDNRADDAAVAVDAAGYLHLSYRDSYSLIYATNASGPWIHQTVDNASVRSTSIAIDTDGHVHIGYETEEDGIKYATNTSGPWLFENVTESANYVRTAIGIDSTGTVHIGYRSTTGVGYAVGTFGSWTASTLVTVSFYDDVPLVVGPDDAVSICYPSSSPAQVVCGTKTTGDWAWEQVDDIDGDSLSLAVDQDGKLHLAYSDYGNLLYATNADGAWAATTVAQADLFGYGSSIVVDAGGYVHISHFDYNGPRSLKYATTAPLRGSTTISRVDPEDGAEEVRVTTYIEVDFPREMDEASTEGAFLLETGGVPVNGTLTWDENTMRFNPDGNLTAGAAYTITVSTAAISSDGIPLGSPFTSGFTTASAGTFVQSVSPAEGSITDTSAVIAVKFSKSMNETTTNGAFSLETGVTQVTGTIDWTSSTTMTFTPDSPLTIGDTYTIEVTTAATDTDTNNLESPHVSTFTCNWRIEDVDYAGDVGKFSSLAIDSSDYIHIGYLDFTNKDIKYATNSSGGWLSEHITDTDHSGYNGISIDIDASNVVHVGHFESSTDYSAGYLSYTFGNYGSWPAPTAIDSSGGILGQHTSTVVDQDNTNVHIAYYDADNQALKYAAKTTGWAFETVDNTANVGTFSSIGIDSSNTIHISYYDEDNHDLKYANGTFGSWTVTALDSDRAVGAYTSLAVDGDDKIHICYVDMHAAALSYLTNASDAWVKESADVNSYSKNISLAVDAAGHAHVSYTVYNELKYATNETGVWVAVTVDDNIISNQYLDKTSIDLDSFEYVHISYYDDDFSNPGLKYVTNKP